MNPIFFVLGLADTFAGVSILFPQIAGDFLFYIAFYSLAKGIFSIAISFGVGYYGDWMGFVDVITGAVLALMFFGFALPFLRYAGILAIIKGLYCTAMPFIYR